MKRALQGLKDKIQRIAAERSELFEGIGEETSERLDHLIATVENQSTEIDVLRAESDQIQEQLRKTVADVETYVILYCRLLFTGVMLFSSSKLTIEEPVASSTSSIDQLQQALAEKDQQQLLLQERLNELEQELRKALDDHASLTNTYEAFVEQQALDSEERYADAE